ncbi:MAG TPA: leucine-rich repeat-containing protein kinase family protein [Variovorax sp.]
MSMLGRLRRGELAGARRLDLAQGLSEFPREIFELADTLEILNLSGNALDSLPDDLHRLHRLRVLFCSDNRFTAVPEVLGRCERLEMVAFKANRIARVPAGSLPPALRWLILTDNRIEALPAELGRRPRLQKLMLAGNRLTMLPDEMADCRALELVRISANRLDALPGWLLSLPRLSWIAFAGNPFDEVPEALAMNAQAVARVDWGALRLGRQLGEGASGVIHAADWRQPDGSSRPVAVKVFKGAVTSDGWPHSEMAACIAAAGAHPNLIAVQGRIENHPEGSEGLLLSLVDAGYANLAGPPSLQSCTRDVYAEGAAWSARSALRMARGIACAVARLHARGILHGDLYGHNILCNDRGDGLLGDFGAASFLPRGDDAAARALQGIESRAFGCLLEELVARCDPAEADAPAIRSVMNGLQLRCFGTDPAQRPSFAELAAGLDAAAG